jgi:hypothetical protein
VFAAVVFACLVLARKLTPGRAIHGANPPSIRIAANMPFPIWQVGRVLGLGGKLETGRLMLYVNIVQVQQQRIQKEFGGPVQVVKWSISAPERM